MSIGERATVPPIINCIFIAHGLDLISLFFTMGGTVALRFVNNFIVVAFYWGGGGGFGFAAVFR